MRHGAVPRSWARCIRLVRRGVTSGYYAGTHPDDKVGWAIGAGLKVNLPMLDKGDSFAMEANYTQGAIGYAGSGIGSFSWCHNFKNDCGYGVASDAIGVWDSTDGSLELTTAWSVVAGMDHHWSPHWKTSLYSSYGEVSYDGAAAHWWWGGPYSGDFQYGQIGSRTVWSPVKHLDLSVDVMYQNLQTANTGTSTGCP